MPIDVDEVDPMPDQEPDHEFWSQTDELAHVHTFARSRGAAPYATLGAVLRRATGCIEPFVVLPATVGGQVSLNLFTAPVGASGGGKDIANAAGHDAVDFFQKIGSALLPVEEASHIHPGTGEGLAQIFASGEETRAHLQVPDVATLEALAGRKGQTLVSQLLAAWMGQPIGFHNNQKKTCTEVDAHGYRLCLSVGVQPENAGFFLSRENHGFPQRFLWLPTDDPYAPQDRPDRVPAINIEVPDFPRAARTEMPIPPEVADEIWRHRWQVLTGADDVDPLDAHIKLTQLKVAASVAILHGHTQVTADAWKIASQLIDVSASVRAGLHTAVEAQRRRENTARALDQADRQAIVEARLTDDRQKRVSGAILRKLQRSRRSTRLELLRACDSSIRADFDPVFQLFLDKGLIVCCEGGDGRAAEYEVSPE